MYFVRSLTSGAWRTIDIVAQDGRKLGEKALIRPVVPGRWCLDHKPIEAAPGVCLSVLDGTDADFFLADGRAEVVIVEPNAVVVFAEEDDAMFFVRKGLGDRMSKQEVNAYLEAVQSAHAEALAMAREGDGDAEAEAGEQSSQAEPERKKRGRPRKAA